jgi:excisionase family DNA binding protein
MAKDSTRPRRVRLLSVKQAALRLGLKERTIRRWILMRKITYVKLGRWVRIPERSIRTVVHRRIVGRII